MICQLAEFMCDGIYSCGLDGGLCDDPWNLCDAVRDDYIDFGDDDELDDDELFEEQP